MTSLELNELKLEELLVNNHITSIFLHLKTMNKPLGVREIQRNLNISSAGSTHWHLQKLVDNGAIDQVEGNKYKIAAKYANLRTIPLRVVLKHYLIGNQLVPNVFFLIFFLINIVLLLSIAFILNLWITGFFIGVFSSLTSLIALVKFYQEMVKK
jgi:hypothetical protein